MLPEETQIVMSRLDVVGRVIVSILNQRHQTPIAKRTRNPRNPTYAPNDATFDLPPPISLAYRLGVVESFVWDEDTIPKDYLGDIASPLRVSFHHRHTARAGQHEPVGVRVLISLRLVPVAVFLATGLNTREYPGQGVDPSGGWDCRTPDGAGGRFQGGVERAAQEVEVHVGLYSPTEGVGTFRYHQTVSFEDDGELEGRTLEETTYQPFSALRQRFCRQHPRAYESDCQVPAVYSSSSSEDVEEEESASGSVEHSRSILLWKSASIIVYARLGIRLLYKGANSCMEGGRACTLLKFLFIKQGLKYDNPASAAEIPGFVEFHNLKVEEILDPLDSFRTFNQFFYISLTRYVLLQPQAIRTALDVYGENVRKIVLIDSAQFGRVTAVCIGAMMVGSIQTTVNEGDDVKRGQEFGYFAFGGSTIVIIFEKGMVEWDKDLLPCWDGYWVPSPVHMNMLLFLTVPSLPSVSPSSEYSTYFPQF
ncbi:hypothetical protein ONZ45_g8525 [Pleurotus djamor]|nr:hypothetical protein ONZ45_g8525 [Pleurotus djamor]